MGKIVNISGYLFARLYDTMELQYRCKQCCSVLELLGSVVLSSEGVNVMLAGSRQAIDDFYAFLQQDARLSVIQFKESLSDSRPFNHLVVKRKSQLVPSNDDSIDPIDLGAARITPQELKQWYDTGKDFTIIDTRNDYEYQYGSFDHAINPNIATFRDFDKVLQNMAPMLKTKPVVVFCTGGIRCEKASTIVLKSGVEAVYQLEGGIINYFEAVGAEHYHGSCFVFDQREALRPDLRSIHA